MAVNGLIAHVAVKVIRCGHGKIPAPLPSVHGQAQVLYGLGGCAVGGWFRGVRSVSLLVTGLIGDDNECTKSK